MFEGPVGQSDCSDHPRVCPFNWEETTNGSMGSPDKLGIHVRLKSAPFYPETYTESRDDKSGVSRLLFDHFDEMFPK